jgi:hypothetical protein
MQAILTQTGYVLKRQGLSIGGKYRLCDPRDDTPLLFIEEKTRWLPPSTTIHVYADEKKKREVLTLKDSPAEGIDTDIFDPASGQKIGAIGTSVDTAGEIFKDAWHILDAADKPIGKVFEKSAGRSALREMLNNELPQQLDLAIGETSVGTLRQKVKPLGYELKIDFSMDTAHLLDRKLGIAVAIFVAFHQGKEV